MKSTPIKQQQANSLEVCILKVIYLSVGSESIGMFGICTLVGGVGSTSRSPDVYMHVGLFQGKASAGLGHLG